MPRKRLGYRLDETIGNPGDWSLTWLLRDDASLKTTCDFCGQSEQRMSYEIGRGPDTRWVCQRCVGRYPFGGVMDGRSLSPQSAREHIRSLGARLKKRTCRDVIVKVNASIDDPVLVEVAAYFGRNLQLSPRYAACLFSAMQQMGETTDIRVFDIQTRSKAFKTEFGALDTAARAMIWPALSPIQKQRLASLGYGPGRISKFSTRRYYRHAVLGKAHVSGPGAPA